MAEHLLWTASNYSSPNRVAYGSVPGGFAALLEGASGIEWLIRFTVIFFCLCVPNLLPLISLGWLPRTRSEARPVDLLLLCAGALLLSCLPRWDFGHLVFVQPLFCVLAGTFIAQSRMVQSLVLPTALIFTVVASTFLWLAAAERWELKSAQTSRGVVFGSLPDIAIVQDMSNVSRYGDEVFVYPYLPLLYFFTDAANPTRYSFLQPGMMTEIDERSAVADLERRLPAALIYGHMSAGEFLRIWPGSDPARLRLTYMEDWLKQRFAPARSIGASSGAIELWLPLDSRRALSK
jgi:hypothetical protein